MEHISGKKCKNCGAIMHYNDLDHSWLICHECGYEEEDKFIKDRFRFRIWEKDKKIYNTNIHLGNVSTDEIYDEKRFVIEQCTGLQDRNGILIYEGDIVKYYICDVDKFNPILRVSYTELLMRFDLVSEDGKYQSTYLDPCFNAKLEVIGNIHER